MSRISHIGIASEKEMLAGYLSEEDALVEFDPCSGASCKNDECGTDILFVSMNQEDSSGIDKLYQLEDQIENDQLTIVFLTEPIDEYLQVEAYKNGVDEIIFLPIGKRLFQHKLNTIKKRIACCEKLLMNCGIGELKFNREKYAVVSAEGEVTLSKREFEILSLLDSDTDKVFTREEIKENVWGEESIHVRTIDVYIKKLRSVLGDSRIKTLNGIGYKLSK